MPLEFWFNLLTFNLIPFRMTTMELMGIYITDEIHTVRFASRFGNLSLLDNTQSPAPQTDKPPRDQLRELLSGIKPSRMRSICLVIPRRWVFLREIHFANLSPQEAESALRLGVDAHSHLSRDEIYFDCFAREQKDGSEAVLLYIPRTAIDPYIEILKETSHLKSLKYILTQDIALDAAIRSYPANITLPAASVSSVTEKDKHHLLVTLHGKDGWEGSHLLNMEPVPSNGQIASALKQLAERLETPWRDFVEAAELSMGLTPETLPGAAPVSQRIPAIKDAVEHGFNPFAICGALALRSYVQMSLHGKRKKPIRLRIQTFYLITGGTTIACLLATAFLGISYLKEAQKLDDIQKNITALDKRAAPLREVAKKAENLERSVKILRDFIEERPPMEAVLSELATLTPDDSWIKNLDISGDKIRITAEGKSALDTMAAWRTGRNFTNIQQVSPVTKDANGVEFFTVEMTITSKKEGNK